MFTLRTVLLALIIVVVATLTGVLGNYIFKLFDYDHNRPRWLYLRRASTAFIVLFVMAIFMQLLILDADNTASEIISLVMNSLYNWRTTQVSMQSLLTTALIAFCCGMVFYAVVKSLVNTIGNSRAYKLLLRIKTPQRAPDVLKRKE